MVATLLTAWDTTGAWSVGDLVEDAQLLCSEIITNAIEHAGTPLDTGSTAVPAPSCRGVRLEVVLTAEHLHIAVTDSSTIVPVVHEPDPRRPRGRGMWIVATIADRWGSEPRPDGKRVWFDIAVPTVGACWHDD